MAEELSDPNISEPSDRMTRFAEAIIRLTSPWYVPGCMVGFTPFFYPAVSPDSAQINNQHEGASIDASINSDPTLNQAYVDRQIKWMERRFRKERQKSPDISIQLEDD